MKLKAFRDFIYAEGSAPSLATLRRRIHEIPGGCIVLGHHYIDLDEYDRATNLRARLKAEMEELEKNPLLKGLI